MFELLEKSKSRKPLQWIFVILATVLITTFTFQLRAEQPPPVITVHAKCFAFEPAEVTVKAGQPVKFVFISDDVPHGIFVQELGLDLIIARHHPVETVITPSTPGDFTGECSRYCGAGHDKMKLTIHVVK